MPGKGASASNLDLVPRPPCSLTLPKVGPGWADPSDLGEQRTALLG